MVVYRPTYANRRQVKQALDVKLTADYDSQVDDALCRAADSVDALCHRRFYNVFETQYWDWPNFQRAYPWRIWFDEREIADVTDTVPVLTSGGNVISAADLFWGPWNYSPPYRFVEINRATSASYGQGDTPQRDVAITAVYGYWTKTRPAGALAAAITDTTSTAITVTDSSLADVGDILICGSEKMLVTQTAMADTGQAQSGSGCSTTSEADNQLTVADGTQLHAGEVIALDAERMYVQSVTGNIATVIRSFDGTVLADHTTAAVYALRALTVTRGESGTTAATHSNSAALTAEIVPGLVRDLAEAEALNAVLQKTTGYARTIGENMRIVPGGSLPDLRAQVLTAFGRKGRTRVV